VVNSLLTDTTGTWVGLSDFHNEGTFVWVDGHDGSKLAHKLCYTVITFVAREIRSPA